MNKTLILFFCLSLFSISAYGQDIQNGSFDQSLPAICGDKILSPFRGGCINGEWEQSHGSPQVSNNIFNSPPRSAVMFSQPNFLNSGKSGGEGIINFSKIFSPNIRYTISMNIKVRDGILSDFFVKLSNNLSRTGCQSCGQHIPTIADDIQTVYHAQNLNPKNGWVNIVFKFTPNTIFDEFWIYPEQKGMQRIVLFVDDIKILKEEPPPNLCCPAIKLYEDEMFLPTITKRLDFIKAGEDVGIPSKSGSVIVKDGQNVTFDAGEDVFLEIGFETELGAEFIAKIGGCSPIDNINSNTKIDAFVPFARIIDSDGSFIDAIIVDKDFPTDICFFHTSEGPITYSVKIFTGDIVGQGDLVASNMGLDITTRKICFWDGIDERTGIHAIPGVYIVDLTIIDCNGMSFPFLRNLTVCNPGDNCLCCNKLKSISSNGIAIQGQEITGYSSFGDNTEFIIEEAPSTEETETINFRAIPNPNSGSFFITSDNNESITRIETYNSFGELVFVKTNLNKKSVSIHKNFTSGIYFIKVWSGEQSSYVKVMIN